MLGSRRSRLARLQAGRVEEALRRRWPALLVEHVHVLTEGDRVLDRPLPEVGGKGLFTAELEAGIRAGSIDAAVHSLKDLPARAPEGLEVLALPERADPRDVLLSAHGFDLEGLPEGSVVGTSSLRRRALLLRHRPDCNVRPVRGNVETRVRKLEEGAYDALILARAGLQRLEMGDVPQVVLAPERWLPAPGQGAIAVQGRAADPGLAERLEAIDRAEVRAAVGAERAFLERLEGSCRVPIGALATLDEGRLRLRGIVLAPDGGRAVEAEREGEPARAAVLGRSLAEELLAAGAEEILAPLRAAGEH